MSVAPTIAASARGEAPSEPESRQRSVLRRALTICALTGFAVVQPLLDLFGKNPEFFVAGDYSRSQIILFVAFLLVVPPVLARPATSPTPSS